MPTKRGRGLIYARSSFLEGMAQVFDLGGTLSAYDFGPGEREREIAAEARKAEAEARKAEFESRRAEAAEARKDDPYGHKADAEAMRSDWQAVGDDLRAVMGHWRYAPDCPACQAEVDKLEAKG